MALNFPLSGLMRFLSNSHYLSYMLQQKTYLRKIEITTALFQDKAHVQLNLKQPFTNESADFVISLNSVRELRTHQPFHGR